VAGLAGPAVAQIEPARLVPWTGAALAPLALRDPSGRPHALDDLRGRVVLVNFWATWCEPCREEMPSVQRLKERLAGRPFSVVAVNYGEAAARVETFVREMGTRLDFLFLLDPGQQAARAWRVRVLPASFLVGPGGEVRYVALGELDWTRSDVEATVRGLLP
jgi:thiol-disulfide isomerase/thioredoxin